MSSSTVKSKSTNVGLDSVSGSLDAYRQGINVRDTNDLLDFTSFKIRSNSDFIRTINGRDTSQTVFDDLIAPTSFDPSSVTTTSGASLSHVSLGGQFKISERLSHEIEQRDIGQSERYFDHFFIDQSLPSAEYIIRTPPAKLVVPERIVDQSDATSFDGVIEPMPIRRVVDRSSVEMPYFARSVKGSLVGEEDKFRHVALIEDEVSIEEVRDPRSIWFLDAVETMGGVDIQAVQNINQASIRPFEDTVDQEVTLEPLGDDEIKAVLKQSNFSDDDARVHELPARRGYIFHYDEIGYDSIAYGGLKK